MKLILTFFLGFLCLCSFSQEQTSNYKTKKVAVRDSILVDSISINSSRFLVKLKSGTTVDSSFIKLIFQELF